eukprot:TRINITY_DN52955_c0_g1_i1.p1 TRINITY_DN52955_c0_g1~~TRINITY_DN52955_c0_g1_i1.p1  ORF type:complete len:131 (-),score=21.26 TRINITY_DN52955_c0_g1_i1:52-444(-)
MFCNVGRAIYLNLYFGDLLLVSDLKSVEDSTGLFKNKLGQDVHEYLGRVGEKHSAKLRQYKLDTRKYRMLRELVVQGQETQALEAEAAKQDNNCPIFQTVSYTHLTLPTILLVQISVVAVSLKKKIKNKK